MKKHPERISACVLTFEDEKSDLLTKLLIDTEIQNLKSAQQGVTLAMSGAQYFPAWPGRHPAQSRRRGAQLCFSLFINLYYFFGDAVCSAIELDIFTCARCSRSTEVFWCSLTRAERFSGHSYQVPRPGDEILRKVLCLGSRRLCLRISLYE